MTTTARLMRTVPGTKPLKRLPFTTIIGTSITTNKSITTISNSIGNNTGATTKIFTEKRPKQLPNIEPASSVITRLGQMKLKAKQRNNVEKMRNQIFSPLYHPKRSRQNTKFSNPKEIELSTVSKTQKTTEPKIESAKIA